LESVFQSAFVYHRYSPQCGASSGCGFDFRNISFLHYPLGRWNFKQRSSAAMVFSEGYAVFSVLVVVAAQFIEYRVAELTGPLNLHRL
jgi:hypothetical protein